MGTIKSEFEYLLPSLLEEEDLFAEEYDWYGQGERFMDEESYPMLFDTTDDNDSDDEVTRLFHREDDPEDPITEVLLRRDEF